MTSREKQCILQEVRKLFFKISLKSGGFNNKTFMKFLIDECLSPKLATVANNRGFEAYHVAHRGWSGMKDPQLLPRLIDENLILVTNNRDDFLALIRGVELHPGLIVIIENMRGSQQVAAFNTALNFLEGMKSMINKVIEVSKCGGVEVYEMPLIL